MRNCAQGVQRLCMLRCFLWDLLQAVVALPRILKPDETRLLWFYLKLGADALLLRGKYTQCCLSALASFGFCKGWSGWALAITVY